MEVIKGARSFRPVGLSGSRTEISRYGDCMDTSSAWQDELVVGSRNKKVRLVAVVLLLVVSPTNPQVPRRPYADGMATTTATLSL